MLLPSERRWWKLADDLLGSTAAEFLEGERTMATGYPAAAQDIVKEVK